MRMRTAFFVAGLIGFLLFGIGVVAFVEGFLLVARMAEVQRVTGAVIGDGRHLALHAHDLLLDSGPRQRAQWLTLRGGIDSTLQTRAGDLGEFRRETNELARALVVLDGQMAEHLAWVERPADLRTEEATHLRASQIGQRIAELQSALDELELAVRRRVEAQLGASGEGLITTFALLFAVYALAAAAAAWFYYRRMHRPLSALESGIHRIRDGDFRFRPDRVAPDEIGSVVDAFNDLLDRRQEAEAALREAEEKYRIFTDFTYDWEDWVDPAGNHLHVTPSCRRMTGYEADEFIADPDLMLRIVHPDDRGVVESHFSALHTRASEQACIEFRVVTRGGEVRWIEHLCHAVVREDGTYLGRRASNRDITQRRAAEEALRRASLYARSLIEASLDPLVTISPDGKITDVNRATEMVTGRARQALIGSDFCDYFTAPEEARAGYRKVFTEGIVRDFPLVIQHTSGGLTDVLYNATIYRDEQGEVEGVFAAARDVTERKRAEDALRRSQASLNEAQRIARIGNWELDIRTDTLTWSEEIYRIFEIDATRFGASYEAFLAAIHPEDRDAVHVAYARSLKNHVPYEITHRLLMSDGRIKHVVERGETLYAPDGSPLRSLGTVQDISERVMIEEELRRQRDFAEDLIDTAQVIILVLDPGGRIVRFNPFLESLSGWTLAEMRGRPWIESFLPERDRHRVDALLQRAVAGERTRGNINPILTRSGEERLIEWYDRVLDDAEGRTTGVLAIGQDVTDRVRTEAELEAYRQGLEIQVAERTRELERAKNSAEAANRAKSVFLANMSHELRTPLNAILGFAQILERDTGLGAEQRRELGTINRSGLHLLSLINDVLEISRIEAGRTEVQHDPFDLDGVLTAVEEMTRVRAEAKGLTLRAERASDLPPHVLGDAHHLRQVLINLLGNAVKFTDPGRGQVVLRVAPWEGRIRFEVIDNGPGIAPEEQLRVFEAFYQTEAGIARGEGTGLGLTLSREFVRLMGGELSVESALGAGATFRFAIPLPPAAAPAAPRHGRVLGLAPGQPGCRVLVAEDHPDNRDLIVRLLGEIGFEVRTAENGEQAVAACEAWRPQLILMDMRMPVMDGYEASRRIRAQPRGREVRIIALTASAFQEERDAILAAGCDEMVRKPIEEERLFEAMGRLLGLAFRYEEPVVVTPAPEADLGALPGELRAELARAAEGLDEAACLSLAEGLRGDHPAEADLVVGLVQEFRFDRLLGLCEGTAATR